MSRYRVEVCVEERGCWSSWVLCADEFDDFDEAVRYGRSLAHWPDLVERFRVLDWNGEEVAQ